MTPKSELKFLVLILLLSLLIFLPSFFVFFTHDDFFHLKIANISSLREFAGFFNITYDVSGFGSFRPLTTQVFYLIGIKIFALNPFGLHLISFFFFGGIIALIYLLTEKLTKNKKAAFLTSLFYGVSASHFGHFYFLGTFQEVGMAFFFLSSTYFYLKYLKKKEKINWILSFIFFLFALLSKETAAILPLSLILIKFTVAKNLSDVLNKKTVTQITPFIFTVVLYGYFRIFHYGIVQGDSYVWDFSARAINTIFWYALWSLNIPEMWVDFVGPGIKINPNLLKYWRSETYTIFSLFLVQIAIIVGVKLILLKEKLLIKDLKLYLFCFAWFIITILPVIFLPLHKFSYYLTLPLFAVAILLGLLFSRLKSKIPVVIFTFIHILLSVNTLNLTRSTNWITSGSATAKRVHDHFTKYPDLISDNDVIVFFDEETDSDLPWLPSKILKEVLSDNNYFEVFHPEEITVFYGNQFLDTDAYPLPARQFIGY